MSLKIDKDNVYFLPQTNKNSLSTALPQFSGNVKSLEFKVKFKPDFSKSKPDTNYGVIMLNGKHLGISWSESKDGQCNIIGSLWTEEEYQKLSVPLTNDKETLNRANDYTYAHFVVDIENGWMRLNDTATKKIKGKLSDDYRFSYLWVGCGNSFENCEEAYKWNFYGNINYVEVIIDGKTVFHSNCDKKTKFKVYDKSGNGNNLLKYNKDWY